MKVFSLSPSSSSICSHTNHPSLFSLALTPSSLPHLCRHPFIVPPRISTCPFPHRHPAPFRQQPRLFPFPARASTSDLGDPDLWKLCESAEPGQLAGEAFFGSIGASQADFSAQAAGSSLEEARFEPVSAPDETVPPRVESLGIGTVDAGSEPIKPTDVVELAEGGGGQGGSRGEGGSGGDGGSGEGGTGSEGGGEEENKLNKKMSLSQKLTVAYAVLVGVGGVIGYLKSKSMKSFVSGTLSGLILFYVSTQLPVNPVYASLIGLGVSTLLLTVMGIRFKNSGKFFPAGLVSIVSFIMTGGYIHGMIRSSHA